MDDPRGDRGPLRRSLIVQSLSSACAQDEKLPSSWTLLCVRWLRSQSLLKPIPSK